MHVHIASLGAKKEPVLKGINAIQGIDKVYLLTSEKFASVSDEVMTVCKSMCMDTETVIVSGFKFQEITEAINRIYTDNYTKRTKFSINITGGTNLMAAAACSCAFLIGADIYYVQWNEELSISEQLEKIPMPYSPNLGSIKGKTNDILQFIYDESEKGPVSNTTIISKFNIDNQNSGYHLRKLEGEKLITITKGFKEESGKVDNRKNTVELTAQGRMVALWMRRG